MENEEIRKSVRSWLTDPNLSEQDIRSQVHDLFESLKDEEGNLWISVPPPMEFRISAERLQTGYIISDGGICADRIYTNQSEGE